MIIDLILLQVGLYVSPHQVRQGDRGLIIIGASLEGGDVASGEGLEGVDGEREGGGDRRVWRAVT